MRNIFNNPFGNNSSNSKRASSAMKTQLQKGGKLQADTPEERFKKMVEEKKQAIMNKNMAGGNNSMKMHLPGTKPPEEGKGLSKSAQKILALMAEKKARKEAKKAAAAVAIKTKYFSNGGKLDANGNLYNAAGKIIGKVDGKTGVIKSSWGANLGKYSDSSAGDYKLSRIVDSNAPKAPASGGSGISLGNFYGGSDDNNGGGNGWW